MPRWRTQNFMFDLKKLIYLFLVFCFSSVCASSYDDFFRAIERDEGPRVAALIARGFDANSLNPKGQNGLFMALSLGHLSAAHALLTDDNLRVDVPNAAGETPLMVAALKGHLEWCQRLVGLGAAVARPGWAPLHYAASSAAPVQGAIVQFLLLSGAEVDAPSPNGTTPLMLAAMYGSEAVVRSLLASGADARRRNMRDLSAADFARLAGREKLADALNRWPEQGGRP